MDGKFLKRDKKVISFTPMSFVATLASIGSDAVANLDGEEIMELVRELPSEIRIVMDEMDLLPSDVAESTISDNDYNSLEKYNQVIVRINGLIKRYAVQYMKNPIVNDGSCSGLLVDFRDKNEMADGTVAKLKNFLRTRSLIESYVGLKELYTEVRYIGSMKNTQKRRHVDRKNDSNVALTGDFDIELLGNFKECNTSLVDVYILNNKVRAVLTSGRALGTLSAVAVGERLARKATPDVPYAAFATYYGCVNTDDTFVYDSFSKITAHDFALMLGKMVNSRRSTVEILKNTDMCGLKGSDPVTRVKALEMATKNLGPKVSEQLESLVAECSQLGTKASAFFDDVAPGSEYDTPEVASYLVAGLIHTDEVGRVRLDEELNMSKAVRLVFSVLESVTKTDLESTDYVSADKVEA